MNFDVDDEIPALLSPDRIVSVLRRCGWKLYGGRADIYTRWRVSEEQDAASILLPLDRRMADFSELLRQAVRALSKADPVAENLLRRMVESANSPGDAIRFRKETTRTSGTIAWPEGESLISSARLALLASAKTCKSRKAYYGNSNSKLAKAYMASVLMGQTESSSYVITAYAPSSEPLYENLDEDKFLPGLAPYTGRDVTECLAESLTATREAIEHYESASSFAGFSDGVDRGVSYEMVTAIQAMLDNSDGADVSIAWELGQELNIEQLADPVTVEFEPRFYPILENASHRLASTSPPEKVTVIGTVTLLERPSAESPGVIRVEVLSGSPAKKIRVRLDHDQYELALEAHKNDAGVVITGRQEREGRYYWLYDPTDINLIDIEPLPVRYRRRADDLELVGGQLMAIDLDDL